MNPSLLILALKANYAKNGFTKSKRFLKPKKSMLIYELI